MSEQFACERKWSGVCGKVSTYLNTVLVCENKGLMFCFYFPEKLISYSIPKGVQRGLEVDLSDQTYDGVDDGNRLIGGLGQLVDGQRGTDNFRYDIHGFGKGIFAALLLSTCTRILILVH